MKKKKTDDEVARCWENNAELWADQVRKGMDGYRELVNNPAFFEFIGELKGRKILDAGCGEGYNTRLLAKKGAKVIGVDISERMIDLARSEEEKDPLGIQYKIGSLTDLSIFPDEFFDIVISFMVLMDLHDYEESLSELFRVLRKKGNLFFSVTHPCFLTKGLSWIKDEEGNFVKLTVSKYYDETPDMDRWRFTNDEIDTDVEPFSILYFPRTLEDYVNGLINSGFTLKEIKEPRPTINACKDRLWLQRWRDHAALFLYFHAVKPDDELIFD